MKKKSVKFRTTLTLLLFAISTLAVAEWNKSTYCAMVRDNHTTQLYIERGLKMRENEAFFLSKNPPKEVIQIYQDKHNNDIKDNYERALAVAYEADNKINKKFPEIIFHNLLETMFFYIKWQSRMLLKMVGQLFPTENGFTTTAWIL